MVKRKIRKRSKGETIIKSKIFNGISKGNITILILIIGLVVVFATSALMSYMFRDIKFTKIDEGKLKALNFAEAGIANIYSNIEKYHNGDIENLPVSPYSEDIMDGGEVQGSFTINYTEYYDDDGRLTHYIIESKGTDKIGEESGEERKVEVKLSVNFSTEVNIFDYIYSKNSMTYDGLDRIINGPFFTGGNLNLRAISALNDDFCSGRILIGGNLDIGELSHIKTGPINVGGDIEMSGLYSYIDHDFVEPLIVMGDIRMKGNTRIGKASSPINLSCRGVIDKEGSARIYYTPPIGDDIFDPPRLDVAVYVNNFKDQLESEPSSYLSIPDGLSLNRELIEEEPYIKANGDNRIKFYYNEEDDKYILEIGGNVIVEGNIVFGENISQADQYIIHYDGKGKLLSTGYIIVYSQVIPYNISSFPAEDLLILMTPNEIDLNIKDYNHIIGRCSDPDAFILGIAGGTATVYRHIVIKGSLIAGYIDSSEGWLSSWNKICYQENLKDYIPDDLPQVIYGGATFSEEWQEVVPD